MTRNLVLALAVVAAPLPALAGGDVILKFPANPSTGYHWVLNEGESTGLDLVTIEGRGYGDPESNLLGAPAPAFFAVKCSGIGAVHLVFDYVAPDGVTIGETRAADIACD